MRNWKIGKKIAIASVMTLTMMGTVMLPERNMVFANTGSTETDEFSELLSVYESKAPEIEVVELSSTFTSSNEIEVYLKASRDDIERVTISGWSGGAYSNFATTQVASYDELRGIYTTTFQLNNLVNTETGAIDALTEAIYSFDAMVYSTNGATTYARLDDVQYAENGFVTDLATDEENNQVVTLTAENDGYVAILPSGEEITEATTWMATRAGTNAYSLENGDETTEYTIYYKAGEEISTTSITVMSDEVVEGSSNYQDDETYSFEISQNSGKNDWTSYEDTPNVFESTIQGMHGETATAVIEIHTQDKGILSFDYMVSSEEEFDVFTWEISGAEVICDKNEYVSLSNEYTGESGWNNFTREFEAPKNGVIILTLTYKKDTNISSGNDKAAISNLKFTPNLPNNGRVIINDGEDYTTDSLIDLTIFVEDAIYMYISEEAEKPSAGDSNWLPLSNRTTYTLRNLEDGVKTIYVWFRNNSGAMSLLPVTDTIKLDNGIPSKDIPILESVAHEIMVKLGQTDANVLTSIEVGYRLANTSDEFVWETSLSGDRHTITGLTEMKEYEVKTRVSDGLHEVVESDSTTIKTKIPSDGIVITSSPSEKTLDNVIVTIEWNNTEYTQSYSLDGATWTLETNTTTSIEMPENGIIYYQMYNDNYETGIQKYVVKNIDRVGPRVEKAEIVSPKTGKYGIGDEVIIELTYDEDIYITSLPMLNIRFDDETDISLNAKYAVGRVVTYIYTIVGSDGGYLRLYSLNGGLIKDSLDNVSDNYLPEATGSQIYAENAAYIPATNTYYATLQNAIKAAGTDETLIQIVANTTLRDTAVISAEQNITIDLNGKSINYESDEAIVTTIENKGNLTIRDSSENAGKITATSAEKSAYTIINNAAGKLNIENGKIEASSSTNKVAVESYGIYNKGSGIVTLGNCDDEVDNLPEIIATAQSSVGIYIANSDGILNYSDGIIFGTKASLYLESGAIAYIIPTGYMEKIETQVIENTEYIVSYLSDEIILELSIDGKTERYLTLIDALARIPKDGRLGEIKMLANENIKEIAKIYQGQNVSIDLNGHRILRTEAEDEHVYTFINNGNLEIKDTSEEQSGIVEAFSSENVMAYAVYNYNGEFTLSGGKLFAQITTNGKTKCAHGLFSENSGKVIFNDGEIYSDFNYINPLNVITPEEKYINQKTETIDGIIYYINYISSDPVVTLMIGETVSKYSSIQQAIEAVPIDETTIGYITMQKDEVLFGYINLTKGKNIQIDLNGKLIQIKDSQYGIYVNGSSLVIEDSSDVKSRKNRYNIFFRIYSVCNL